MQVHGPAAGAAVLAVVHDGEPGRGELHADLMRPPCVQADLDQRCVRAFCEAQHLVRQQRPLHVLAGSVHDVDLLALIHNGGKGQGDGDLALDLLGVVVAGGVAVGGLAQTVDALGHKQHLLDQRGLAGPAVAQQRNIANVISSHSGDVLPSFSSSPPPTRLRTVAQCTDYSLYCRT